MRQFVTKNEQETYDLAKVLADQAKAGSVWALFGELGSGKTTFTKALAKSLGVKEAVTSPTFVISKEYYLPKVVNGIKKLIHIDCYRLDTLSDYDSEEMREKFSQKDALIIVEWPERVLALLPEGTVKIKFEYLDKNSRKVSLNDFNN